jgi:hypothetical protein
VFFRSIRPGNNPETKPIEKALAMTAQRALSKPFVTVCVSLKVSFSIHAANLTIGYQDLTALRKWSQVETKGVAMV